MSGSRKRKVILPPGRGRKKLAFALTPLADAMFQLLIFFMLSSSLAPYSLITLTPGAANAVTAPPAAETGQTGTPAIWNLSNGVVRAGREQVLVDDVDRLISGLQENGIGQVIVFSDRSATVQDVATVLNRLTLSGVGSVELIAAEGR